MATQAPAKTGTVDFGRSFSFVTEDPEWVKKILIGGAFTLACALLVGVPFVLGYFSRTLRNVVAGEPRPMPDWDDLGGIFNEGLRLTAVYLLYTLGIVAILAALGCVALLPVMALSGRGADPSEALGLMGGLGIVAVYGLVMVASLALAVYLPAALARAALRGTVADGFAWREIVALHQGEPRQLLPHARHLPARVLPVPVRDHPVLRRDLPRGLLGLHGPGRSPRPDRSPQPHADLSNGRRAQRDSLPRSDRGPGGCTRAG